MSSVSLSWTKSVKTTCPVFSPTPAEFSRSLYRYLETLDFGKSTACVINPPSIFTVTDQDYSRLDDLIVTSAVTQTIHTTPIPGFFQFSSTDGPSTLSVRDILRSKKPTSPAHFWKRLSVRGPQVYGSDFSGTLFKSDDHLWQLNSLTYLFDLLPYPIPGVSTPFLYFGSAKSCFPMHTEDLDLPFVNFLHSGYPKVWYVVHRGSSTSKLSALAAQLDSQIIPQHFSCKNVLRHKDMLLTPAFLTANGISFDTIVQKPGHFVISLSRSYHMGLNTGPNIAEAVNFATDSWVPYGRNAVSCSCGRIQTPLQIPFLELFNRLSALESATSRLEARVNSLESLFSFQNHPFPSASSNFLPQVQDVGAELPSDLTSPVPSTSALPNPRGHSPDLSSNPTFPVPSTSALPIPRVYSPELPILIHFSDIHPVSPLGQNPIPPLLESVPSPVFPSTVPLNPFPPDSPSIMTHDLPLPLLPAETSSVSPVPVTPIPGSLFSFEYDSSTDSSHSSSTVSVNPSSPLLSIHDPSPDSPIATATGSSSLVATTRSHRFFCTLCSTPFASNFSLIRHQKKQHSILPVPSSRPPPRFLCPKCSVGLSTKYNLHRHLRTCRSTIGKNIRLYVSINITVLSRFGLSPAL